MTIDKAIKYLDNYPPNACPDDSIEFTQAIQLGTEALKAFKYFRRRHYKKGFGLLPGETG